MTSDYYYCARCGHRYTTGGNTKPNQCCADCVWTDPTYCARLMGTKPNTRGNDNLTPQQLQARREALTAKRERRNQARRNQRAQQRGAA